MHAVGLEFFESVSLSPSDLILNLQVQSRPLTVGQPLPNARELQ